jgi:hypothetical protein
MTNKDNYLCDNGGESEAGSGLSAAKHYPNNFLISSAQAALCYSKHSIDSAK